MAQSKRMAAILRAKAEPFAFVVRAISQPKLTRKQLIALATASLEREQEINAAVPVTGKDRLSCSDIWRLFITPFRNTLEGKGIEVDHLGLHG